MSAATRPVVYVSATDEIGGGDQSLWELVSRLDRARFTPHVVLPHRGPFAARYRQAGVATHVVPLKKLKNTRDPRWHAAWLARAPLRVLRLGRLLAALRPAVVHVNSSIECLAGLAARRHCERRRGGAKLVWHVREMELRPAAVERVLLGAVSRWADAIVAISTPIAARFTGARGRVVVVPNPIDVERFRPDRAVAGRGDPARPVLGWVGRVAPRKGLENVLSLFAAVRRELPAARLLVQAAVPAGHEAYVARLRAHALAGPDGAAIDWRDGDHRPEAAYAAMHLFAHLPDLREGLGRTLIEAQACGVPTLTWARGGVVDAVLPDRTGIMVAAGDLDAAAAAAVSLLRAPERTAALGAEAVRFARERFAAPRHAAAIQDLYDELVPT